MKVYLFGECYFQNFENLLTPSSKFEFENLSISSGNIKNFLTMLQCKKGIDRGVFLVGGSVQDKWSWHGGENLRQITNLFNTYLFDSLLVFCLTGPFNNPEDLHNFYNEEKRKSANQRNIFSLDLRFDANKTADGLHVGIEEKMVMAKKTMDFLEGLKFAFDSLEFNYHTDTIPVTKPYRSITILHGNNGSAFEIANNGRTVRKYALYSHPDSKSKGYIPYLDRPMFTEIQNPQIGEITFSEKIYVDKVIVENVV